MGLTVKGVISPEGALVRVLAFLPKSLVEKIHETGRLMSRYIRKVLEEKLLGGVTT